MKRFISVIVFIVFFLPLLFTGCDLSGGKTRTIKYEVSGDAPSVSIKIIDANSGMEQIPNVLIPWNKTFTVTDENYFAYISAKNDGAYGSITAAIYVDGKEFRSLTRSGAYVTASVSGDVD